MGFKERYENTLAALARTCADCGRDASDVTVVAVSKTVGVPAVEEAVAAGCHNFGENRPDMLAEKERALPDETWHFIGNVQSRKIPEIVACASLVHSLYQTSHIEKFDRAAASLGKVQDVLLEVNVSGEASKSGMRPEEVAGFLAACAPYEHVRVRGLMTMAPQGSREAARRCFDELHRLLIETRDNLDPEARECFNELSMGMSEDWEEAVAAGATIVRIGRALFSDAFSPSA